jgi:hypothetical protein
MRHTSIARYPERLQHGLLRDEAEGRWKADHRGDGEDGDGGQGGPAGAEAAERVDVAGAGRLVDDADHEEEGGFEQGVGGQEGRPRERGGAGAAGEYDADHAELADRPVGEQQFQVGLAQRRPPAEEEGEEAADPDDLLPRRFRGEDGGEHPDQEHAGLDHGGGVEVGADRRRRGHGGGQPEAEGEEGRLRQGAEEDQHEGDHEVGAAGQVVDHFRETVGAGVLAEHDESDEHRQAAEGGHDERLHRRPAARALDRVVADQKVGEDGGELPEDVEQEQVVGDDEAEHGAGEADEDRGEPPGRPVVLGEVVGAVGEHEGADAADEEDHDPWEGGHPEGELLTELRHPRIGLGHFGARADRGGVRQRPGEGRRRYDGNRVHRLAPPAPHEDRGEHRNRGVGDKQPEQTTPKELITPIWHLDYPFRPRHRQARRARLSIVY